VTYHRVSLARCLQFQEPLIFLWRPQFFKVFRHVRNDRMGFDNQTKRSAVLLFLTFGAFRNKPRSGISHIPISWKYASIFGSEGETRWVFVAFLIALAAIYYWDVQSNQGALSDGVIRMGRSMLHHIGF
jgi:hypothetical protein